MEQTKNILAVESVLRLVLRLRKSRASPPVPQYAFIAWGRGTEIASAVFYLTDE